MTEDQILNVPDRNIHPEFVPSPNLVLEHAASGEFDQLFPLEIELSNLEDLFSLLPDFDHDSSIEKWAN